MTIPSLKILLKVSICCCYDLISKLSLLLFSDYDNAYYPQYECNVPLLDQAVISATSALRERGPENARLNGKH